MVAAKHKLAPSRKMAMTFAAPLAKKTTTLTPVVATAALISLSKRPCLEAKTIGNVAQPQKCIKKITKKGEHEIHVILSQTTAATTLSIPLSSSIIQVLVKRPRNPSTPTMGQATEV